LTTNSIAVVMPVFNEEQGILAFVNSIAVVFSDHCDIHVVDDCSTDNTLKELMKIENQEFLFVHRNPANSGHGQSTVNAINHALLRNYKYIITVDGDGQITPGSILELVTASEQKGVDVVEGRRIERFDGVLRELISAVTRLLVFLKSWKMPKDANTPFRCYKTEVLSNLVARIPEGSLIPNLWISILCRRNRISLYTLDVASRPRLGATEIGSTWSGLGKLAQTKKLMKFCYLSTLELIFEKRR
jgi:glycosyltransferase involved in cell wall biosynthesis